MARAEPAKPSTSRVVSATCGPNNAVTGLMMTPGSRNDVFHIRFTPCGAFIATVVSAGSRKCLTATSA